MKQNWLEDTLNMVPAYYNRLTHASAWQRLSQPDKGLIAAVRYCIEMPDGTGSHLLDVTCHAAREGQQQATWCIYADGSMPVLGILEVGLSIAAMHRTDDVRCIRHFARAIGCFDPIPDLSLSEQADICSADFGAGPLEHWEAGLHYCRERLTRRLEYAPRIGTVRALASLLLAEETPCEREISLPWLSCDTYTGRHTWSLERVHLRLIPGGTREIVLRPEEMALACLNSAFMEDLVQLRRDFENLIPDHRNIVLWIDAPPAVAPVHTCGYGALYIGMDALLHGFESIFSERMRMLDTIVLLPRSEAEAMSACFSTSLIQQACQECIRYESDVFVHAPKRHIILSSRQLKPANTEIITFSQAANPTATLEILEKHEGLATDPLRRVLLKLHSTVRSSPWVTITGESGVGKSLIVRELANQLPQTQVLIIDCIQQGVHNRSTLLDAICVAMGLKLIGTVNDPAGASVLARRCPTHFLLILDGLQHAQDDEEKRKRKSEIGEFLADWANHFSYRQRVLVTSVLPLQHHFEREFRLHELKTTAEKRRFLRNGLQDIPPKTEQVLDRLAERISGKWNVLFDMRRQLETASTLETELPYPERESTLTYGERRYNEITLHASSSVREAVHYLALLPAGADISLLQALFGPKAGDIVSQLKALNVLKQSAGASEEDKLQNTLALSTHNERICLNSAIADYTIEQLLPAQCLSLETNLENYFRTLLKRHARPNDLYPSKDLPNHADLINMEAAMRRIEERYLLSDALPRTQEAAKIVYYALEIVPYYWWDGQSRGQTMLEAALRAVEFLPPGERMGQRAECYYRLGQMFYRWAQYRSARRAFTYARYFHISTGDQFGAARDQIGMADCYQQQDELKSAKQYYKQAQHAIYQDQKNRTDSSDTAALTDTLHEFLTAYADQKLGEVYCKMGNLKKASQRLEASIPKFRLLDNSLQLASSYRLLGWVAQTQGDYEQAISCYTRAQTYCEAAQAVIGLAHLLAARGEIYWWQDRYIEAQKDFQEASDTYEKKIDRLGKLRTSVLEAQNLRLAADRIGQGTPEAAIRNYNEAYMLLESAEELGRDIWVPSLIADCVRAKADIHRKKAGRVQGEAAELEQAIALYHMAYIIQHKRQVKFGATRSLLYKGKTLYLLACAHMQIEPYVLPIYTAPSFVELKKLQIAEEDQPPSSHEFQDRNSPQQLLDTAAKNIQKAWKRCKKMEARHLEAHCIIELIYIENLQGKDASWRIHLLEEAITFYQKAQDKTALDRAKALHTWLSARRTA